MGRGSVSVSVRVLKLWQLSVRTLPAPAGPMIMVPNLLMMMAGAARAQWRAQEVARMESCGCLDWLG